MVHGISGDGWHTGLVEAAYAAVVGICLMLLAHMLGGTLFITAPKHFLFPGIVATSALLTVPLAVLFWHWYDGWAWLWFVGWMVWSTLLYKAVWVAARNRFWRRNSVTTMRLADDFLKSSRWTGATVGGFYLGLAYTIGMPDFVAAPVGTLALLMLLAIVYLETVIRREARQDRRNGIDF